MNLQQKDYEREKKQRDTLEINFTYSFWGFSHKKYFWISAKYAQGKKI